MSTASEQAQLRDGARSLGLTLSADTTRRFSQLLDELVRWNRAYKLTAITDREAMITRHVLDSLAIHADLRGHTVADVGSGAGFPGLPLAMIFPERQFTLIDSNNKKVRFIAHAARVLQLENVEAVHARVEDLRPAQPFDTVVARAFAPLPQLLEAVAGLCGPQTRVLAMKGKHPGDELAHVPDTWKLVESRPLTVPGLNAERCLLTFARA